MLAENQINRYDYVICSDDMLGIIHHIPSRRIVKCSTALAQMLKSGLEQEPMDMQVAQYLAENFEINDRLEDYYPWEEKKLTRLEVMLTALAPDSTEVMTEEILEEIAACIGAAYDSVENVTFFGAGTQKEQERMEYLEERLVDMLSKPPVFRMICEAPSDPVSEKRHSGYECSGREEEMEKEEEEFGGFFYEEHFCSAGFSTISVCPDGEIYPCHSFGGIKEWRMGSVFDRDWESGEECLHVRNAMNSLKRRCNCSRCAAREGCVHCMSELLLGWGGKLEKGCQRKKRQMEEALLSYCRSH